METFSNIFSVAVGGAFGTVARYLINISPLHTALEKFPLHTFIINIFGSFLIGFFLILFTEKYAVSEAIRLAVLVGFLGAFTTFSTLELEIWTLIKDERYLLSFAYLTLSITVGFIGLVAGISLAKKF